MYKNNNIEKWRNYGREVNDIRYHLLKIICHNDYQKLLPKKEREYLRGAFSRIEKFRDKAEDEMFKRTDIEDTKIWYPGPNKKDFL
jgi:hypothetical protein